MLIEHPAVAECLVMGIDAPRPRPGGRGRGGHVRADGDQDTSRLEQELREYAAGELAYFKVPSHWRFTDSPLPRNATGKVVRAAVTP